MSRPDALDRFDAVCHHLSVDDTDTRDMVPEVQALAALYSLDMTKDQNLESLLVAAAESGHTHLVKTGMLSLDFARQQQIKWAVAQASLRYGHLSLAKWLHASFHLSAADVRSNNNSILRGVCFYGHLAVVQYLHITFQLTRDDARANDNYALRWACSNGHVTVLEYLHVAFQLMREDVRAFNNYALRWACRNGHIAVIEYLHTAFQLTNIRFFLNSSSSETVHN
jgi:ankyrin repeat protein